MSRINLVIFGLAFFGPIQAEVCMGIVTASNYVGDRETAWRIKIAGENLGWTVFLDEDEGRTIHNKKLDFVICMLPNNNFFNPHCPNYQMIFHPYWYLDEQRRIVSFYEQYDGYLLTINDRESLAAGFNNKKFHYIPFYPSVHGIPYRSLELNNLVTMIPVWGERLNDEKYRKLYRMLSQTGFVKFYGVHKNEHIIAQGYEGAIPFDGVSVIDILQKHGIVLVLHSEIHNQECIPTSRIFEAAAASTVIICDENPFVKQHFGDSVFYIDTTLAAEDIFDQIQAHLQTIALNPEKALEMAKRGHQIFTENFTMEEQLLRLEVLNQRVISR